MIEHLLKNPSDLSSEDLLIAMHLFYGHSVERIAEERDISVVRASHRIAFIEKESGALPEVPPVTEIDTSSTNRLSSIVDDALKATQPKKPRRAVKTKPQRSTTNNRKSPLEVEVSQWSPTHLLKYFEIRWCEQSWKTPPPRWSAKDRANAKRILETYTESVKPLIDYLFDHWSSLQGQFKITGLPNIS